MPVAAGVGTWLPYHVSLCYMYTKEVDMEYGSALAALVKTYREDLLADLKVSQTSLARARRECEELEAHVHSIETLLAFDSQKHSANVHGMTLHEAMEKVIAESPLGMLRAADIASEIHRRGLYRMQNGRPVEAQQIRARVGHYRHLFEREGNFIKLASGNRK
jgi:hypothetical protein